ncbi:hypothetical protein NX059_012048 [Plenodomus lindquistii]|nr:hypothetical protein NX059_012048 [Plenodomus lindquistii]
MIHNPSFDLATLGYTHYGQRKQVWSGRRSFYNKGTHSYTTTNTQVKSFPAIWALPQNTKGRSDYKEENHSLYLELLMPFKAIDITKVDELEDLDGYSIFNTNERNSDAKAKRAASRAAEHISFSMVGYIGPLQALRNMFEEYRKSYLILDRQEEHGGGKISRGFRGPYNKHLVWVRPVTRHKTTFRLSTAILRDLGMINDTGTVEIPQSYHMTVNVRDRPCLAYIQQTSHDVIASGGGTMQAVFAANQTAEYIERGFLTKSDVLAAYCKCEDSDMQAATEHVCMTCYTTRMFSDMSIRLTDNGVLIECHGCSSRSSSSAQRTWWFDVEHALRRSIQTMAFRDANVL